MKRDSSDEEAQALAHDFNNLLTAIIGATDAVLERSGLDPETRADIAHIREGVRRGALLVRRLRGDADGTTLPPEIISVNETIRATYRLLDHRLGANATLALKLTEPDGQVRLDPSQLDRVLLNLITNARHAMPTGGTVTMGTARRVVMAAEQFVPDTVPPGDYVVISVVDTGIGIQENQISRVFEAGFSAWRKAGGSGLGLASTRDIVRRSNGYLSVESVRGQGTRFEIYLPRIEDAPPRAVPETTPVRVARTVLLVEDDMLVRDVAEWALRRAGWTVLCADSAEGALGVLKEAKCDLMISDIAMPGMDGVALARLVLARQPGLPVILTSGYQRTVEDGAPGLANVVFLTKPYHQVELLATIARIVETGD
jgi:two-component system cell cycle sensor histidine kinase/response regulator CckA